MCPHPKREMRESDNSMGVPDTLVALPEVLFGGTTYGLLSLL